MCRIYVDEYEREKLPLMTEKIKITAENIQFSGKLTQETVSAPK